MKKILLILLVCFTAIFSFAQSTQFPIPQNLGSANTLLDTKGGGLKAAHINLIFADTTAANAAPHFSFNDGTMLQTGDSLWLRYHSKWTLIGTGGGSGSDTLYVIKPLLALGTDTLYLPRSSVDSSGYLSKPDFISFLNKMDSTSQSGDTLKAWANGNVVSEFVVTVPPYNFPNGLISTGGITLVDSTVTIVAPIVWNFNNVQLTQPLDQSFIINSADSGYYRNDVIWIDSLGSMQHTVGTPDTAIAITPAIDYNGILVTVVSVYGDVITTPIPVNNILVWHQGGDTVTTTTNVFGSLNSVDVNLISGNKRVASLTGTGVSILPNSILTLATTDATKHTDFTSSPTQLTVQTSNVLPIAIQPAGGGGVSIGSITTHNDAVIVNNHSLTVKNTATNKYIDLTPSTTGTSLRITGGSPFFIDNQGVTANQFNVNTQTIIGDGVTSSTAANASTLLDLQSTNKGLLIPRMITTQMNAISSPATGLLIWNTTDSTVYQYRGLSGWSALGSGSVTLQQAFDAAPTANPQINAHTNNFTIDSLGYTQIKSNTGEGYNSSLTIDGSSGGEGASFNSMDVDGFINSISANNTKQSFIASYDNTSLSHTIRVTPYRVSVVGDNVSDSSYTKFGIGTDFPDSTLTIHGGLHFDLPSKGAGKVLTSDASGAATWQTPSGGGVSSVTASSPLASSGGTTPNITADTTSGATKLATQGFVSRGYKPIFSVGDSAILNQYASKQIARFWADSGKVAGSLRFNDDSAYIGYSPATLFPYVHPLGAHSSINISAGKWLQDINLFVRDSASQVNFNSPLGFVPIQAAYGPDFGTTIGGFAYRKPAEAMVKNFGIWRMGQHLWESDSAQWYMSLTPTGLNLGSIADNILVPKSALEVARSLWANNGNMTVGSGYARTYAAPTNGAAIQGPLVLGLNTGASSIVNSLTATFTMPTSIAAFTKAVDFQVTSAGSSSQANAAFNIDYLAGYTGSSRTIGLRSVNGAAGTGTAYMSQTANLGIQMGSTATTTGTNVGGSSVVNGGNINLAYFGLSVTVKNSATNIGATLFGRNTGTSGVGVGAYIGNDTIQPTISTASALIVDNSTAANPIAIFRDNGTAVWTIADGGNLTAAEGINIITGTTTGTKIGTSTSQKIGFWNVTPVVQPTTGITAAAFVANTSGTVNDSATFGGYTIGQIAAALKLVGILQ